jgi:hypothetical protein
MEGMITFPTRFDNTQATAPSISPVFPHCLLKNVMILYRVVNKL